MAKHFLKKLSDFTGSKIDFVKKWSTKKVKRLFRLKDKNPHPAFWAFRDRLKIFVPKLDEFRERIWDEFLENEFGTNLENKFRERIWP